MKTLLAFFCVISAAIAAQTPAFIKVGNTYSFAIAGQREPILATVIKDEGEGWVRVASLEGSEEIWLNLAQVQVAVAVDDKAAALKAATERSKIMNNLRQIAAAVERYRLDEGREPASVSVLAQSRYLGRIQSVAGEDYQTVEVAGDNPLTVTTKEGLEYSYPRK